MSIFNDARIAHSEAIEQAVDDIVEIVLQDNNVEWNGSKESTPVSSETWLAAKAKILALLAMIAGE